MTAYASEAGIGPDHLAQQHGSQVAGHPRTLGKWRTIYGWFDLWNANGTLQKVVDRLTRLVIDAGDLLSELWCIDGTIMRAHRCAVGGEQVHDSTIVDTEMMTPNHLTNGCEEPVAWPIFLAGDKDYRADWIDEYLLDLKVTPVIPSKENEDRSARSVDFEKERYRQRNIVERVIGWLKEYRHVFSRFEKSAKNSGGMLRIAFTQRYITVLFG